MTDQNHRGEDQVLRFVVVDFDSINNTRIPGRADNAACTTASSAGRPSRVTDNLKSPPPVCQHRKAEWRKIAAPPDNPRTVNAGDRHDANIFPYRW